MVKVYIALTNLTFLQFYFYNFYNVIFSDFRNGPTLIPLLLIGPLSLNPPPPPLCGCLTCTTPYSVRNFKEARRTASSFLSPVASLAKQYLEEAGGGGSSQTH